MARHVLSLVHRVVLVAGVLFALTSVASAQQQPPPPGYGAPPPAYQPGYQPYGGQPGYQPYGQPGYQPYGQPGYGYGPPPGPPPPPKPPAPTCCRWSVRFDPFDLLLGRLSFQGEVAIIGPLAIELEPSWIWGTPSSDLDESGFAMAANVGVYFDHPLRGFWLKGSFGFESFEATLTAPVDNLPANFNSEACPGEKKPSGPTDASVIGGTCTKSLKSAVLGVMIGSTSVLGPKNGRNGGFAISGGIGIGVALADPVELTVRPNAANSSDAIKATYYDGIGKIKLLGSLGLGVAF